MIINKQSHNDDLYNIILILSRNIFFYKKIKLPDTFQTRVYLMFFHFSIMMIISKRKGYKFDQNDYDQFFNKIEYNLRELGFGDVSVNKKMKELNQILYDILLKLELKNDKDLKFFKLNPITVKKYFVDVNLDKKSNFNQFESYFRSFFNYCFELSPINMLEELNKFKY